MERAGLVNKYTEGWPQGGGGWAAFRATERRGVLDNKREEKPR